MSKESIEELRNRLLRDSEIQNMIRMRAYEIYQLRGGEPGYQAEDWFRAEWEILQFLIEEESRRSEESAEAEAEPAHQASAASAIGAAVNTSNEQPPQPLRTVEGTESNAPLGVWSATEPASASLAPPVGNATEFQVDAPKKSRSPRKTKGGESSPEGTAKKTTRRAASKKATDSPAKPRKSRKKSDEPVADNQ